MRVREVERDGSVARVLDGRVRAEVVERQLERVGVRRLGVRYRRVDVVHREKRARDRPLHQSTQASPPAPWFYCFFN